MICEKVKYQDKKSAVQAIKALQKSKSNPRKSKVQPVKPYKCSNCDGWHVSSEKHLHKDKHRPKELHTKEAIKPTKEKRKFEPTLIIRNFSSKPI